VNSFNFWPLLAGSLGIPLYLWFKFTLSNVTRDWDALLKDGLASAIGFSWLGLWLFLGYDNWLHWIGLGVFVWSLTFWLSTGVAWQRVRAEKKGEKPAAPFSKSETAASKGPNRKQRRARRKS
jgi:hypothetical protein